MKIRKIDLYFISVVLIIFIGIFNTSQFGATFSWILIPALLLLFESIFISRRLVLLPMHLIAISFWFICVFSTMISSVVDLRRDCITFFFFVLLFVLVTGNPKLNNYKDKFLLAYIFIGLIAVSNILFNYFTGNFYNPWFQRATVVFLGVSRDPNYVGAFLAPIPIMLVFMLNGIKRKAYKVYVIISISLTFVALIVDGSRGALISAALPLLLYYLFQVKSISKRITIMVVSSVLLIIGVYLAVKYLPEQTVARLLFMESADTRSNLWKAGIKGFLINPIVGQGLNSSTYYANMLAGNHSHNMYIDILSASGFVGALLYISLLWLTIRGRQKMSNRQLLLSISFHLPMFFINGFNSLTMWIPIMMCYIYSLTVDKKVNEKEY